MEPGSAPWRVLETPTEQNPLPASTGSPGLPKIAIGVAILAVLVTVVAVVLAMAPRDTVVVDAVGSPSTGATVDGGTSDTAPVLGTPDLVVEVAGAVARPGVYHLAAGSRIADAIAAAGGFGAAVDALAADQALNLAAPIADGEEIRVPVRGEASAGPSDGAGAGAAAGNADSGSTGGSGGLVDVNHATAEELDTLPGVGPATAAKIIAARDEKPFASLDDMVARKVVTASTLQKLRGMATAGR